MKLISCCAAAVVVVTAAVVAVAAAVVVVAAFFILLYFSHALMRTKGCGTPENLKKFCDNFSLQNRTKFLQLFMCFITHYGWSC